MELLAEEVLQPIEASAGFTEDRRADSLVDRFTACWPEWATVSAFAAVVAFAIPFHEPFADEAQAWQLARSLPLADLFRNHIRYEGTPGLWHLLLWMVARLHFSYSAMHWLCGAIALGATALLVFRSPFPCYLKLLLPFTFFLLFQYAVVARSYVLVPLLLFLISTAWKRNRLAVAVLLGLLANAALHAACISAGLALVYGIENAQTGQGASLKASLRSLLGPAAVLAGFYAFALWTVWPPHDSGYTTTSGSLLHMVIFHIAQLCQPWLLPVVFWIAIATTLRARGKLLYLLPAVFFFAFSTVIYAGWWHLGLLFPLAICLLWITWPAGPVANPQLESLARIPLLATFSLQVLWSAYAIQYDHTNAYSPDLATAQYLRPYVEQGAAIAVTYSDDAVGHAYRSVGIQPYFDKNIFVNVANTYWSWSSQSPVEDDFLKILPHHPQLVVVEVRPAHPGEALDLGNPKVALLTQSGYRFTHMFCGAMPDGFELKDPGCHLIFEHTDPEPHPSQVGSEASI